MNIAKNTINPHPHRFMMFCLSQERGNDGKEKFDHTDVLHDLWLNQLFGLIGFIIGE